MSASDARQQASVYVCVHDSVVFFALFHNIVYFITLRGEEGRKKILTIKALAVKERERERPCRVFWRAACYSLQTLFSAGLVASLLQGRWAGLHCSLVCLEAAPAFGEGGKVLSCSQPRLVGTHALTNTHVIHILTHTHTHTHTLSCSAELCLLTTTCCWQIQPPTPFSPCLSISLAAALLFPF